jgi:Cyclin, N-terminal domain/Cyclin, C-terminal domain
MDGGRTSAFVSLLEREELAQKERKLHSAGRFQEMCAPNIIWREKVVQWCYDVADHLDEDRSIVYVAMNILDRYCSAITSSRSDNPPIDETMYEVASLSSIFLAIRIAGSRELLLDELVSMSRGGITMQDIIAMGNSIISELSWEHSILTPIDFVQSLFHLQPSLSKSPSRQLVLDTASYLLELAVCDAFFSPYRASRLAVVALLCSLEANVPEEVAAFKDIVKQSTSISLDSDETCALCTRLQSIYSRSVENFHQSGPNVIEDDEDCFETGERSVVDPCPAAEDPDEALCRFSPKREFCTFAEDDLILHKRSKIEQNYM